MGVHLTFVRSLDLDEWTQSQIDAMRLGGNRNARSYFRKHGYTDLYGGKPDKKYKSKAAVSYRAELAKMVTAEAAKRGEIVASKEEATENGKSLLDNLDAIDQKNEQEEAKAKLEAAKKKGTSAGVLQPKAKLASSMSGASKLLVTKPANGGLGTLRKPTSSSSGLLKKKPSTAGKLRINKLSMKLPVNGVGGGGDDDDKFEDIEQTQQNAKKAEEEAKQKAEDTAMAKKLEEEMYINGTPAAPVTNVVEPPAAPVPTPAPKETAPKAPKVALPPSKEENIAKLKSMTSDFWSQM